MELFRRKSIMDILKKKNDKLAIERQRINDEKDKMVREIQQKVEKLNIQIAAYNDESVRNSEIMDNQMAEIDRMISKNKKQMKLEKEYFDEMIDDKCQKTCPMKKRVD